MLKRLSSKAAADESTGSVASGYVEDAFAAERRWQTFSASCYGGPRSSVEEAHRQGIRLPRPPQTLHRLSNRTRSLFPSVHDVEVPDSRFGIWDSGPSHSSSDERLGTLLKRTVVFLSLMAPLLPSKPANIHSISAADATRAKRYENW